MPTKLAKPPEGTEKAPQFISGTIPLYYQLQSILSEKILSGSFAPGEQLPTEAKLVEEYGVSRITVRQALAAMERENLIRREVGRGTFVTRNRTVEGGAIRLEGSMDDLISLGMSTSVKVLNISTVKASSFEASVLGLAPEALLVRCTRLRLYKGEPYSHVVNDLPHEIGTKLTKSDWKGSVTQVLQEKLGIPLIEAHQSVRASLAGPELARVLTTRIGAPLLSVDRVLISNLNRPVDRVRTHYRSDIFQFNVRLTRASQKGDWSFDTNKKKAE